MLFDYVFTLYIVYLKFGDVNCQFIVRLSTIIA